MRVKIAFLIILLFVDVGCLVRFPEYNTANKITTIIFTIITAGVAWLILKEFKKSPKEKAASQRKNDEIMEKGTSYMGYPLQNLGPITAGSIVTIKMHPNEQKISLSSGKNSIDLPYSRILGFSINYEASLSSGKISIGGAIIGSALFGSTGAILGGLRKKGRNKISWIGTLLYESKEGEKKELNFKTYTIGSPEKKTLQMNQFEMSMNKIAVRRYDERPFEL